ncbi:MAG: uroporphyrinogen-III synthase [Flavobacteriales bacterium]
MKIKTILVTQPAPTDERSPYFVLAKKFGLKIDFKPFIKIEAVPGQEFRQERINVLDHTAIVLTSRNAVDHFFRMCKELRLTVPESMKYFCVSESVAYYVQKYIVYRKRKVFIGKQSFGDLIDVIKKHKGEKFLVPGSDIQKAEIPKLLDKAGVDYTNAVFYRTVASDLSDMRDVHYDMLVFFSPGGIESLRKNFPEYEQKETVMAAFGPTTAKAVRDAGLRLDIEAPLPEAPSMTGAIELFLKNGAKIDAKTAKAEAKRSSTAKKTTKPAARTAKPDPAAKPAAKKVVAKPAKGGKK